MGVAVCNSSKGALSLLTTEEELSLVEVRGEAGALVAWDLSDPFVVAYREESARSPFVEVTDRRRRKVFLVRLGDRPVGVGELTDIRRGEGVCELRICLAAPGVRGRGLGRQAVALLLDHARDVLSLRRVYLRVAAANRRAVRCYLAAGFEVVGVLATRRRPERVYLMSVELVERPSQASSA
jgi:RimJ/RimL family protein N-acetyltransferase